MNTTIGWKEKKVSILGTQYTILLSSDESKYETLKKADGFIDTTIKQIVVRNSFDTDSDSMQNLDVVIKKNIRHEIIHAFLYESGLDWDSNKASAWACNEEMTDWLALQFPKFVGVFKELDIL